jgi:hypothetical protein
VWDPFGGKKKKCGGMVVLKKIRASSLVETLTASVIIVVIFMIASFSFNNVFLNTIKSDDEQLTNRIQEIKYFTRYESIKFPFYEEREYWIISAEQKPDAVYFEVQNLRNKKEMDFIIKQSGN